MKLVKKLINKLKLKETEAESLDKIAKDAGVFWSESESDEIKQGYSHWLGKGIFENINDWEDVGNKHYEMFQKLCQFTNKNPNKSILEWGPGGGSNLVRFAKTFKNIYGVDISEPNLTECKQKLIERANSEFSSILIKPEKPEECLPSIVQSIDFFLCTAVYQHFPSKEYGVRVTKIARDLLVDGGLAIIQIRYDDGTEIMHSKVRDYKKNAITFTSYLIDEFWKISISCGLTPKFIQLEPKTNYAYFFLVKEL